jgi:cation diffusion facilitator CzcD-associated flavoprotein CzcO
MSIQAPTATSACEPGPAVIGGGQAGLTTGYYLSWTGGP